MRIEKITRTGTQITVPGIATLKARLTMARSSFREQNRNLLTTLFLAQGTPLLLAGDEFDILHRC
jgi:hypothetical protein